VASALQMNWLSPLRPDLEAVISYVETTQSLFSFPLSCRAAPTPAGRGDCRPRHAEDTVLLEDRRPRAAVTVGEGAEQRVDQM